MRAYNRSHLWSLGNAKLDVQLVVRSRPWLCIHVLKSGEDFSASTSFRFQNVIPIPTLEVKPAFSCKTTLMHCRTLNGLRTILLVKTKRVSLFIPTLRCTCIVVHMHPSHATKLLASLPMYLLLSSPLHKDRYGHSSQCWFLVFIIHSCFFCIFPVY